MCLLYRNFLLASNSKLRKTEIGKELINENKPCRPWLFNALERSFWEVFKRFFSTNFAIHVAIYYVYHEIYFYVFFTSQNRKNIKIWHFRNVTFMVYIIIKALYMYYH